MPHAEIIHMAETGCAPMANRPISTGAKLNSPAARRSNTDGGCLANGEPIGASLRQIHENVLQLRRCRFTIGRSPGNPEWHSSHVYGAPGLSGCTVPHQIGVGEKVTVDTDRCVGNGV